MDVWVFTGYRQSSADTAQRFPGGVFSSLENAEAWIRQHSLSGIVTLYRLDVGAYDWAVANGYFKPSKPHHRSSEFIGQFAGGDVHYHYESGARLSPANE
jgi:hypothetical protein